MRSERPRLSRKELKWNLMDWFYEVGGWVLLFILWAYIGIQYGKLPEMIPTHFALDGTPDDYSKKQTIFILPAIVSVLYAGLTVINNFPHVYLYQITITPLNARRNYVAAVRKVRFLKFIIVIMFCFICFQSVQVALDKSEGLGKWFLPMTFIFFIVLTLVTLFGSLRHTRSEND